MCGDPCFIYIPLYLYTTPIISTFQFNWYFSRILKRFLRNCLLLCFIFNKVKSVILGNSVSGSPWVHEWINYIKVEIRVHFCKKRKLRNIKKKIAPGKIGWWLQWTVSWISWYPQADHRRSSSGSIQHSSAFSIHHDQVNGHLLMSTNISSCSCVEMFTDWAPRGHVTLSSPRPDVYICERDQTFSLSN